MSILDDILDLLLQDHHGIIVASNIVDCFDGGLVDEPFLREFFAAAKIAFVQEGPNTTEEMVGMLAKVALGELPVVTSSTSSIARSFLFGCGVAAVQNYSDYSCILNVGMFKQYLVSDVKVNQGHSFFLSNPDPVDPGLEHAIASLNWRNNIFKPSAKLGGGQAPLFWVHGESLLNNLVIQVI